MGDAIEQAAGAAAIPPVAEATATSSPAFDTNGSWPDNSQETLSAGLWSPEWFSTWQLHHESVATVAAQSPVDYHAHDDEHLSASEPIGVGGIERKAAEETAAPPAAIATPAAAGVTAGSGSRQASVHGTPKAVP